MNKTILIVLFISTVLNSFAQTKKVSIDKNSFGSYPAILFNVDNGTLTQLNKKESEAETFKGIDIENGLFIEPNDAEIACINLKSKSEYPRLIILDSNYDAIGASNGLEEITKGTLFIVETNNHNLYKFLIISFDKENEKLEFEYEELE